jgi:hypothetical protein
LGAGWMDGVGKGDCKARITALQRVGWAAAALVMTKWPATHTASAPI